VPAAYQHRLLGLLIATATRFDAICARVRAEHPHDNPESLAVPEAADAEQHAAWQADAVSED
jgi:uncharacterized protein involved in tolerance to divalent cations